MHPNECVAVELTDGRVYVKLRDQNGSSPANRTVAYSSDGGETFDARFTAEPGIRRPWCRTRSIPFSAADQGERRTCLSTVDPVIQRRGEI